MIKMQYWLALFLAAVASTQGCTDLSTHCSTWQKYCKDANFKNYMDKNCPSTCGKCVTPPTFAPPPMPPLCFDKEPKLSCEQWQKAGYCAGNFEAFMRDKCAKSCGFCSTGGATMPPPTTDPYPNCKDKSTYCDTYKDYCTDADYVDYLQKECKRTCNYCHITTPAPTTPKYVPTQPYTGAGGRDLQPGCGQRGPTSTRIVGGTNAKAGDWRWQVNFDYLFNTGNPGHHCGGTLITPEWVVSAAHCFIGDTKKENYWLKMGEHDIHTHSKWERRFNVSELHLHPQYTQDTQDYDLALIKLSSPVLLNARISTACLPGGNTTFPIGKKCWITGWGLLEEYGNGAAVLQQAQVPLVDRATCQKSFSHLNYAVTPRMLCAGYTKGGIDSCEGDSGGPLVCEEKDPATGEDVWYLWGAISWGVGCARKGMYGVLANIKVLRPWIDQIVFNM